MFSSNLHLRSEENPRFEARKLDCISFVTNVFKAVTDIGEVSIFGTMDDLKQMRDALDEYIKNNEQVEAIASEIDEVFYEEKDE